MLYRINQKSPEWFEIREGKITASMVRYIASMTALSWSSTLEKIKKDKKVYFKNAERGYIGEDIIIGLFAVEGINIVTDIFYTHDTLPIGATPDFVYFDTHGMPIVGEVKTMVKQEYRDTKGNLKKTKLERASIGKIDDIYQVLTQMILANTQFAKYIVVDYEKMSYLDVKRDNDNRPAYNDTILHTTVGNKEGYVYIEYDNPARVAVKCLIEAYGHFILDSKEKELKELIQSIFVYKNWEHYHLIEKAKNVGKLVKEIGNK